MPAAQRRAAQLEPNAEDPSLGERFTADPSRAVAAKRRRQEKGRAWGMH